MNTPYQSIYEALPDSKALKATKNKSNLVKSNNIKFNKLKQQQVVKKIDTLIRTINSLINKFRNTLPKTNAKKLKIQNSDKFLSWKVSIFPKKLSGDYDEVAVLQFSVGQEKIRNKIFELFIELDNTIEQVKSEESYEFLPEKYSNFLKIAMSNDWTSMGSFSKSAYDVNGLINKIWKQIGITPATSYEGVPGLYRLHATNAPPACLKGQFTGKPGIGLLMYKGFIHYCGHGFTSSQSDEAKNVWMSIKKDSDIISFEYEDFRGLIAISTLLPKESVIQILDRFLSRTGTYKSFYSWCKTRMDEGDELEDILDNELYSLIQNDIEQIKAGVSSEAFNSVYNDWYGGNDEQYDDEESDEYLFDIENFNLNQLFYDGFTDDQLSDYIKLFRKDIYDSTLENYLDEGLEQSEAEEQTEQYMKDLKIIEYWEHDIGENLYDTYLDYYERQNGEEVSTSRVVEGYGIDMDSFKKDGMYYHSVDFMFQQTINRLERQIVRNESNTTNQSSIGKSSNTRNNYRSKGSVRSSTKQSNNDTIKIGNLEVKKQDEPEAINWDIAMNFAPSGYRLPTKKELKFMYDNRKKIGGFKSSMYWSSDKEKEDDHAWYYNFDYGILNVRLVRNVANVRYVKDI